MNRWDEVEYDQAEATFYDQIRLDGTLLTRLAPVPRRAALTRPRESGPSSPAASAADGREPSRGDPNGTARLSSAEDGDSTHGD